MEDITSLKKQLEVALQTGNQKNITTLRGRLIKRYKEELEKYYEKTDLSIEEKQNLEEIEKEFKVLLYKHKLQLDARYREEFIDKRADVMSLFTVLPNSIGLAVQKVKTCIDQMKLANSNRKKSKEVFDVVKALGLLVSTPVLYLGKFALNQWYIFAVLIGAKFYGDKLEDILGAAQDLTKQEIESFSNMR